MPRSRLLVVPLLAVVAVGVSGCGSGGTPSDPLAVMGDGLAAGGRPVGSIGPSGIEIRFVERGAFGIGFVLRNRSRRTVTVVDARTPEPAGSLLRQAGTRLAAWRPTRCPAQVLGCPLVSFLTEDLGPVRPAAVKVAPGRFVSVQVNYRLPGCGEATRASTAAGRTLVVSYRDAGGLLETQTFPIATDLLPELPRPNECLRPHSRITIAGPYATSSGSTIPGSYGDTCTRTASGGLEFESASFSSPGKPRLSVAILLPRYRGAGTYRSASGSSSPGASQVVALSDIGTSRGSKSFRSIGSLVSVSDATGPVLSGRFHATLIAYRTPFDVSGIWRCTTAR